MLQILTAEYVFLGILSALTGIMLSLAANWALSTYIFEITPAFPPWALLVALLSVTLVTVIFGLLGNRKVLDRPPLEVLRVEG